MKHYVEKNTTIPKVLQLDSSGTPTEWISYSDFATLSAKGKILWTTGKYAITLRGGTNAVTGKQSTLDMDTIVAIKSDKSKAKRVDYSPPLSNRTLFERDRNMCAYCGNVYPTRSLTRDHIIPVSKNGKDNWLNVVTACMGCNQWKSNYSLEEIGLVLLYVPYKPSHQEHLILQNRNILEDQMLLLLKGVSPHSPVYKEYMANKAA